MGWQFPFSSFPVALLMGAVIGLVMGGVIMLIRKAVPEGVAVGGTSIMMGAGNAIGRYLAPLIVVAATQYDVYAGIGAIFYKWGKELAGGAILGAMLFGGIFL